MGSGLLQVSAYHNRHPPSYIANPATSKPCAAPATAIHWPPDVMTHILHRHLHVTPPVAVAGRRRVRDRCCRQGVSRRQRRSRRIVPRARPSRGHGRDARADRSPGLRAHQFLHLGAGRGAGRPTGPQGACRARARVFRERRLGSHRGGVENGAPVFRRNRRAASAACSSRAGRAITATRLVRSRWEATSGDARCSRRS